MAIITGAGQGIGAGVARSFAAAGFTVSLMSPSDRSVNLASQLGGIGRQGSALDPQDLAALVEETRAAYGRIDAVVNNMGHGSGTPPSVTVNTVFDPDNFADPLAFPDQTWHDALDTYVLTAVRMARAVTPMMVAQGGGAIVNISSMNATEPRPGYAQMSVLRASLHGFTKLFADKYARHHVRMNNVMPGYCENVAMSERRPPQHSHGPHGALRRDRPRLRVPRLGGVSLHADVAVPARRRDQLERVCRYIRRPPLALERRTESTGGQLLYQFRRPWRDGSTALLLDPLELLGRLAALVPPPRRPLLAYLWAPRPAVALEIGHRSDAIAARLTGRHARPEALALGSAHQRVFGFDVLGCDRCGSRRRILGAMTEPHAVRRLLAALGLAPEPPPGRPAPLRLTRHARRPPGRRPVCPPPVRASREPPGPPCADPAAPLPGRSAAS